MKNSHLGKKASSWLGFFFAAMGIGLSLGAAAQDSGSNWSITHPVAQTTQFGISPFCGYRFGGGIKDDSSGTHYNFEDAAAYGLFLDYAPTNAFGRFELLWSRQDSSVNFNGNHGLNNVDVTIDVIQIGGELEYGSERFRAYVSVDIGATHFSSDGHGDATEFSSGLGLGTKVFLAKNIYLRADVRGFSNFNSGNGGFISDNGTTVAGFSGTYMVQGQVSVGVGVTF